jgi:hypothetical protein
MVSTFHPSPTPLILLQSLEDFPPEILARIFLNLSYKSLLSVLVVCAQWHEIVTQDPALSVQMFRRASRVYVEPGAERISLSVLQFWTDVVMNRLP